MIEDNVLTELCLYDTKIRKKEEHGDPALANMTNPANAKYYMSATKGYLQWHGTADETKCDKSFRSELDDAEEPADETKYDESFGVDFLE